MAKIFFEASCGIGAKNVTVKIDWLWVRFPLGEMKYLFTFIFSFLRSGVDVKVIFKNYSHTLNTH